MALPPHGANPRALYESMNLERPNEIIDFSENTNPLGPPEALRKSWDGWFSSIFSYPDPEGLRLRKEIALFHHVSRHQVLLGNGTAELMMAAARLFQGKKVGIIHPAFSEYERVLKANDCGIHHFYTQEENGWEPDDEELMSFLAQGHALFVCNPVNPTGLPYSRASLEKWICQAETAGGMILLDEAFIDMVGEERSMSGWTGNRGLLIFRSMTKMFSIAGLRLGYLLGSKERVEQMKRWLPHWNVNALALEAGELCISDRKFQEETRQFIHTERTRLFSFYKELGFKTSASQANYYLLQPPDPSDTSELFEYLLKKGLVLRHTENYRGIEGRFLRAGIKTKKQNDRLMQAVKEWQRNAFLL
ncbi:threonine-phosphate decarboxylase CobD [Jeotgalibacillus proteolyticus]|uniref:threonine-phosphate decarboxylase n=1 Tax=Jeotgalibacillus proteolyticus TaxID=2082395 RepID=A0A2S5G9R0_9BACL|nr:threonine-phosphate decarboxylase CobD [Jeotgalibacillus proteolyticus]PPA69664.1 threonine-phosphate decarboxylase [Jeotgalibacillus proteolyticus]